MAFFNEAEWASLQHLPIQQIVDLAADLDICPPAEIDRRALLEQCVLAIVERARSEGLPFSRYDRADLEALDPALLNALGQVQGLTPPVTADAVLKAGRRVYRHYAKHRPDNPVALMLPTLLTAVARAAMERSGS